MKHLSLLLSSLALVAMPGRAADPPDFAWVRSVPITAYHVAVAVTGESVVFGFLSSDGVLGTNTLSRTNGLLVLTKFDRNGNVLWTQQVGNTNLAEVIDSSGVALDRFNNIYVSGWASGGGTNLLLRFGSVTTLISTNRSYDLFVAKYDAAGNLLWARGTGGIDGGYVAPLVVDNNSNVVVSSYGTTNTFLILKLDQGGNELWRLKPTAGDTSPPRLAVDKANNIYLSSQPYRSVTLDGILITNSGGGGSFVAKVDPAGHLVWVRLSGGNPAGGQHVDGNEIALDSATNVVVVGESSATNAFGFQLNTNPVSRPFILQLTPTGSNVWLRYGSMSNGSGGAVSVTIDAADEIYVGGLFTGTMVLSNVTLNPNGSGELFFTKYSPGGEQRWAFQAGGPTSQCCQNVDGLAAGPDGVLAVGRYTSIPAKFGSLTVTSPTNGFFIGLLPYPTPNLTMVASNSALQFRWPTFPPNFLLESTTDLAAAPWTTNGISVATNSGSNFVTFPLNGQQQFFRLRRP
ncbi:MAG TPA: SBBP repeat-containing protein [Verrucomicrobiae bacterium]|jgi:hypothetical protein